MSDYANYVLSKLNEDRTGEKRFCDFTIKTESKDFLVHRCVLGSVSEFFKAMFSVNMTENYQNHCSVNSLQPDTIFAVVEFVYGNLDSITIDNIYNIVEAADFLQIQKLLEFCIQFLSNHMTAKVYFRSWEIAKQYNLVDLQNFCKKYVGKNFSMLSKRSECLALKPDAFQEFLESKSDRTTEERVYETLVNWISFDIENRESYFGDLFLKIDLDKISTSFLNMEISSNDLVLENAATSKKLVEEMRKRMEHEASNLQCSTKETIVSTGAPSISAVKLRNASDAGGTKQPKSTVKNSATNPHLLSGSVMKIEKTSHNSPEMQSAVGSMSSSLQPGLSSSIPCAKNLARKGSQSFEFILVGGKASPKHVRKYNTNTKKWKLLSAIDKVFIDGQLICLENILYRLGGRLADNLTSFVDVWSLNLKNPLDSWSSCLEMKQRRHRFGCTIYQGHIVVAGGLSHETEVLASVESYYPPWNVWLERPDMNLKRVGCCLVVYQKKIYALGGSGLNKNSCMKEVEIYQGNSWSTGISMQQKRSDFAAVVCDNKIFAIGGKSTDTGYQTSVECFCNGKWQAVASLKAPRAGHGAVVGGNKIFVCGGANKTGPVKSMEMYDLKDKKWQVTKSINGGAEGMAMALI